MDVEVIRVEIAKIELKPGDVLAFRVTEDISQFQLAELRRSLNEMIQQLPGGVVGFLLPHNIEVSAVASKSIDDWREREMSQGLQGR